MMLSEILIVTVSGEPVVIKKYRHDVSLNTTEVFTNRVKDSRNTVLKPYFVENDIRYFFIKRQDLYFVATTKSDMSSIFAIEFLTRVYHLCKDFCGKVNEESIRKNLILLFEVLDELVDFGHVQLSSTEKLKPYIQSEPIPLRTSENQQPGLFGIEHRIASSEASNRPVIKSRWDTEERKNEIFLDVIERLAVLISENGTVVRCNINGQMNMKSFLIGCPDIKLGLNEDLTIGRGEGTKGCSKPTRTRSAMDVSYRYLDTDEIQFNASKAKRNNHIWYGNMVHLDDCSFHSSVKLDEFQDGKILAVRPPEGEFAVMSYHLSGEFWNGLPLRVYSYLKDSATSRDLEMGLKLRCEIPSSCHVVNVVVSVPVPKTTRSIGQQLSGPGQTAELISGEKKLEWKIKKIPGKSEVSGHFKLISANEKTTSRMELGPVALNFECSGYVCSGLQIRFVRVFDREHSYVPFKWVRYITTSDSYVCKLSNYFKDEDEQFSKK